MNTRFSKDIIYSKLDTMIYVVGIHKLILLTNGI